MNFNAVKYVFRCKYVVHVLNTYLTNQIRERHNACYSVLCTGNNLTVLKWCLFAPVRVPEWYSIVANPV